MTSQTAWVIMANDHPQRVHLGTEAEAEAACQRLATEHRNAWYAYMGEQSYRARWYWRTYAVRHTGERDASSWAEVRNAFFNLDDSADAPPADLLETMTEYVLPSLDPQSLLVDRLRGCDSIDARRAGEHLLHALRELPGHIAAEFLAALAEE